MHLITVIRFAIILLVIAFATRTAQGQQEVSAESYIVYSAVLSQHYGSWFRQPKPVLISSETVLEPQGHAGGGCHSQAEGNVIVRGLLDKLLAETRSFRIEKPIRVPGRYKMVTGKLHIRENDETGIFFLSAVEFSDDRSKAMVLVGRECGALCGTGYVWLLDKSSHGWEMAKNQLNCGWIK